MKKESIIEVYNPSDKMNKFPSISSLTPKNSGDISDKEFHKMTSHKSI